MKTKEYEMKDFEWVQQNLAPSLNVDGLLLLNVGYPKDNGEYILFVATNDIQDDDKICPVCKSKNYSANGYASGRIIHDITWGAHRTEILYIPKRLVCKDCGTTWSPQPKGIDEKHPSGTKRLIEYLRKEVFVQPYTRLSQMTGYTIPTIRDIMDEEIDKFEAELTKHPLEAPQRLGIDEKHFDGKAHGVLVDLDNGKLLDMVETNTEMHMKDAIKKLHNWDKNIEIVTTDMNASYTKWLPHFLPNATIVIDKFHVVQDVVGAVKTTAHKLKEYRQNQINAESDSVLKDRQQRLLDLYKKRKSCLNTAHIVFQRTPKSLKSTHHLQEDLMSSECFTI